MMDYLNETINSNAYLENENSKMNAKTDRRPGQLV